MKSQLVSVIIPTYNNEKTIEQCITTLKNQTYPKIEIIIVDNKSSDKTQEICKKHKVKLISKKSSRTQARNIGIKKAKGKFIFNIDSDMYFPRTLISECIKKIKNYDALCIDEKSIGKCYWSKVRSFERSLYSGNKNIDAARFLKKKVIKKIKGYDEELNFGEDWDLQSRINKNKFKTGRLENPKILHDEGRVSLKSAYKTKKFYGKSMKKFFEKNPERKSQTYSAKNLIVNIFLKNWKKILKHPVLLISVLILKGTEYLGAWRGIKQ